MISLSRISAIIVRHMLVVSRDLHKWSQAFFWPLLDIVIWGFIGRWIQQDFNSGLETILLVMAPIALWQIVFRVSYDISGTLLEELWAHNLINLFTTPLKLSEWIIASMTLAALMGTIVFSICIAAVYFFFGTSLLSLGWTLLPTIFTLFFSGLSIGFATAGLLIVYGARIQSLVFMSVWLFVPLAGVYYSVTALPPILQTVAYCLPMAPAFQSVRQYVATGYFDFNLALWGCVLSVIYFVITVLFFKYMFRKSKRYGLARLVD